jgi:hypothetical protein
MFSQQHFLLQKKRERESAPTDVFIAQLVSRAHISTYYQQLCLSPLHQKNVQLKLCQAKSVHKNSSQIGRYTFSIQGLGSHSHYYFISFLTGSTRKKRRIIENSQMLKPVQGEDRREKTLLAWHRKGYTHGSFAYITQENFLVLQPEQIK